MAIQIFTYKSEIFKSVCSAMDKNGWTGINAMAFQYFTSSQFCEYASPVQLLSQDPDFDKYRTLLADDIYHLKESIFRLFVSEVNTELCKLTKLTCTGAELRSVTEWTPDKKKPSIQIHGLRNFPKQQRRIFYMILACKAVF